jgi:hypothetical protein
MAVGRSCVARRAARSLSQLPCILDPWGPFRGTDRSAREYRNLPARHRRSPPLLRPAPRHAGDSLVPSRSLPSRPRPAARAAPTSSIPLTPRFPGPRHPPPQSPIPSIASHAQPPIRRHPRAISLTGTGFQYRPSPSEPPHVLPIKNRRQSPQRPTLHRPTLP